MYIKIKTELKNIIKISSKELERTVIFYGKNFLADIKTRKLFKQILIIFDYFLTQSKSFLVLADIVFFFKVLRRVSNKNETTLKQFFFMFTVI
jgi:hypothetical protein